jgi:xanthosine utilization system XapX-like protein
LIGKTGSHSAILCPLPPYLAGLVLMRLPIGSKMMRLAESLLLFDGGKCQSIICFRACCHLALGDGLLLSPHEA